MANTKNVGVNLTREEMKEAFNQFIDMMYDKAGNTNIKVPKRLVKSAKVSELVNLPVDIRPSTKPTNVLETKRTHTNKNKVVGYIIDLAKLTEMYNEFVSCDNYEGLKQNNPTKEISIMDKAFNFNEEKLEGEGRVTEGQVWALERVGEFLGLEPYSYLLDAQEAA